MECITFRAKRVKNYFASDDKEIVTAGEIRAVERTDQLKAARNHGAEHPPGDRKRSADRAMSLSAEPNKGMGILRLSGRLKGVEDCVVLVQPITTVGRHPSSDITLPRSTVSRFHARVVREGPRYFVEDLNSSNGTFLNTGSIERAELCNLDKVLFGDVEFTFYLDEEGSTGSIGNTDSNVLVDQGMDLGQTTVLHTKAITDPDLALAEIGDIESVARASKYLKAHYQLLDLIHERPGQDRLLSGFLELLVDVLQAGRGAIMLEEEGREGRFQPAAVFVRDEKDLNQDVRISKTIVDRCVNERLGLVSRDAVTDERFSQSDSVMNQNVRATVCVPLLIRDRIFGVCYLDSHSDREVFDETDLSFVANLTSQLALAIDNLRMARERAQAEQLVLIGQTMAEISHSIKNVLSIAGSSMELMERYLKARNFEKMDKSWDMIRHAMERIHTLATDMLNYSRNEKRQLSEVCVNETAKDVYKDLKLELDRLGIGIELTLAPDCKPCWLDSEALYNALMNLAVNACDAIADSNREGHIQLATGMGKDCVTISLSDNGPGIPPEMQESVFHPFFTTKGANGTGMGLAMVKKFVHEMGGEITLHSDPDNGATFRLAFPIG